MAIGIMNHLFEFKDKMYHLARRYLLGRDIQVKIPKHYLEHVVRYQFAAKHMAGNNVIDAACGTGYGFEILKAKNNNINYIGIDYDSKSIDYAKSRYKGSFVRKDLTKIGSILVCDTIISFETIEHLPHPGIVLDNFYYWLRLGGVLILSIPLNHPDRIYHRHQYNLQEVRWLISNTSFLVNQEYIQDGLHIKEMNEHDCDRQCTYVAILKK